MKESAYLKQLLVRAGQNLKTVVLPESEDNRVLEAAHFAAAAKAARIIILGRFDQVAEYYRAKGWDMEGIEVVCPETSDRLEAYAEMFYELRKEKGVSRMTRLNWNPKVPAAHARTCLKYLSSND